MKEIVKYENYMNSIKFSGFTNVDLNFLMAICAKMKNMDTKEITFTFAEIKEITNHKINSNERFADELERMNEKLMKITCKIRTEKKRSMFVLFHTFDTDLENSTLTIGVNEKYKFILNNLVENFTQFELNEFINLNSKYSKNLYRFLKQYKSTGAFYVSDIEDFKEKMCCPKSYSNKEFMRTAIQPSLEELKPYFKNLKIEVKKAKKRGSPVIGYIFTFEPEKPKKKSQDGQAEPQEQTQPKQPFRTSKPKTTNRFNQFQQREYSQEDMANIEKMLLQRK